jgi:hypothetical protein
MINFYDTSFHLNSNKKTTLQITSPSQEYNQTFSDQTFLNRELSWSKPNTQLFTKIELKDITNFQFDIQGSNQAKFSFSQSTWRNIYSWYWEQEKVILHCLSFKDQKGNSFDPEGDIIYIFGDQTGNFPLQEEKQLEPLVLGIKPFTSQELQMNYTLSKSSLDGFKKTIYFVSSYWIIGLCLIFGILLINLVIKMYKCWNLSRKKKKRNGMSFGTIYSSTKPRSK